MAKQTQNQSLVHREMARRAQDTHRVHNPTDQDYKLVWDGYVDTIPAGKDYDVETYKMEKYLREMSALMLRKKQEEAVEAENKRRRDRGEKEMDKWAGEAQHIMEGKFVAEHGANNPEVLSNIYKELYVGLVKEYGLEKIEKHKNEPTPTTHEQIMAQIMGTKVSENDSKAPIEEEIAKDTLKPSLDELNQPQLMKIAKEKGLDMPKTSKKDELIKKISQA